MMDSPESNNATGGDAQLNTRFWRRHGPALQYQRTCNQLQAVGNPVLQFQGQYPLSLR